jgi:hypothetical protein
MDRRRSSLTFQHHAEVASLPVDDQERLLDFAERCSWTSKRLRSELRKERQPDTLAGNGRMLPWQISVPDHRVVLWQRAATEAGEDFEHWIINNLDQAAGVVLGDGHPPGAGNEDEMRESPAPRPELPKGGVAWRTLSAHRSATG